jgi:predicted dehydrogenase
MNETLSIGLIGCGVIGERRAQALPQSAKLIGCFDTNPERSHKIATQYGCESFSSAEALLSAPGLKAVVIAAVNSALVPIMKQAAARGIHILVEKPAARSYQELLSLNPPASLVVKIGFNHRFHPAFIDLQNEIKENPDDPIMFIRAQYGNGARVGFEKEWRSQVPVSGGGELLDQGVHVLDLASCLLPDLQVQAGYCRSHFWDAPVDDNTWAILSTPRGATFSMHVSSSEWKNEFRFEVYTKKKKYQWLGLGRSYGPEKLIVHAMKPEMGPPETTEKTYPPEDHSWLLENQNFLDAIRDQAQINGGYKDGLRSLALVEKIYQSSLNIQGEKGHPQWWKN